MDYVVVDRVLFARLKLHLPAITRKHLMEVYGISETTWCKMRDQKPLKSKTLTRVLARLELAIASSTPDVGRACDNPGIMASRREFNFQIGRL
jgi:hypothetical protein